MVLCQFEWDEFVLHLNRFEPLFRRLQHTWYPIEYRIIPMIYVIYFNFELTYFTFTFLIHLFDDTLLCYLVIVDHSLRLHINSFIDILYVHSYHLDNIPIQWINGELQSRLNITLELTLRLYLIWFDFIPSILFLSK